MGVLPEVAVKARDVNDERVRLSKIGLSSRERVRETPGAREVHAFQFGQGMRRRFVVVQPGGHAFHVEGEHVCFYRMERSARGARPLDRRDAWSEVLDTVGAEYDVEHLL